MLLGIRSSHCNPRLGYTISFQVMVFLNYYSAHKDSFEKVTDHKSALQTEVLKTCSRRECEGEFRSPPQQQTTAHTRKWLYISNREGEVVHIWREKRLRKYFSSFRAKPAFVLTAQSPRTQASVAEFVNPPTHISSFLRFPG